MITNLLLIQEIAKNKGNQLILIFIDLEKAFDSVNQGDIIELMNNKKCTAANHKTIHSDLRTQQDTPVHQQ